MVLRCRLCLLLKYVQDVHSVGETCDIDYTIGASFISNTDFPYAWSYNFKWFPILRILAVLHALDLVADFLLRRFWKLSDSVQRGSDKTGALHWTISI